MRILLVVYLCYFLIGISSVTTFENNSFVATNKFQELKSGQSIPAGLHVRINLQTGKKEAKLLNDNDVASSDNDEDENESTFNSNVSTEIVIEENNKTEVIASASTGKNDSATDVIEERNKISDNREYWLGLEYMPTDRKSIEEQIKSYHHLKKTYESMSKMFKTDAEIIVQLINEFHNITRMTNRRAETKIKMQLQILYNFNNLISQIDNAILFLDRNGLDKILLPLIVNQTHTGLKVEALRVLGALTQNNPKVQVKVYEHNFGSYLTQILLSSRNTEELSAALYAFGSLLRKFPYAQGKMLSTSGMKAIIGLLEKDCELKLKAKVVTLIHDLIVEKNLSLNDDNVASAKQYKDVHLTDWLLTNSYCAAMSSTMAWSVHYFFDAPDLLEYFLNAIESTYTICLNDWLKSSLLRDTLISLQTHYKQSSDEYHLELLTLINNLLQTIYNTLINHDEL